MHCWNCSRPDRHGLWWGVSSKPWLWICDRCKGRIGEPCLYTVVEETYALPPPLDCVHGRALETACGDCQSQLRGRIRDLEDPHRTFPPRMVELASQVEG